MDYERWIDLQIRFDIIVLSLLGYVERNERPTVQLGEIDVLPFLSDLKHFSAFERYDILWIEILWDEYKLKIDIEMHFYVHWKGLMSLRKLHFNANSMKRIPRILS